ncbi:MAG TPA: ABC transporter substrate-binding protein [Candidatus Limnocylindrales bacterium]|nr:ABC transporter substrate-binding protein [Candidatus Limnocylindrales bacterium]
MLGLIRSIRPVAPLALGFALLLAACGGSSAGASPAASNARYSGTINIASSTWTGYAVIYLANARGTWKAHNLTVNFTDVEDPVQRLQALNAGQLQGMASTVDAFARAQAQGVPAVDVFPIDASVGGDGILAKNSIASIKDIKGKTVAVNQGSVSEWFLAQVLQRNGMSLKDVTEQNMTSGQAGAAFVAGRVDVAVTWEPWLTRASKTAFGRVLVSSKQYPDLIMDAFAFRKDFVQNYPGTVQDFVKAYYDAYNWMTANQDQANALIGAAVKESATDVQGDLSTMTIFSLSQAKQIMGTNSNPGKIFTNAKAAGDFWKAQGQVSNSIDPKQAVDASFVASMS